MKVVVTGGTGFIGGALVRKLADKGDDVTCLIRPDSHYEELRRLGVTMTPNPKYSECDIVYHIAGQMGKEGLSYNAYREPAVILTANILKDMSKGQKFVFMSSQNVTLNNVLLDHLRYYRDTKTEGEGVVRQMAKEREIEYRIIRPGTVYGEGDYHHLPLFKLIRMLGIFFPIVGSGNNKIGLTYVDDVTKVVVGAFDFKEETIPVAGKEVEMKNVFGAIARAFGVGRPLFHIPAIRIEPFRSWLKVDFFASDWPFTSIVETVSLEKGLGKCIGWYKEAR